MADESTTTLENKIERANEKKLELVEKINELRVVNADLNNDLRDRDETYDRLKEREKIANEEIRTKDREVENCSGRHRQRARCVWKDRGGARVFVGSRERQGERARLVRGWAERA